MPILARDDSTWLTIKKKQDKTFNIEIKNINNKIDFNCLLSVALHTPNKLYGSFVSLPYKWT